MAAINSLAEANAKLLALRQSLGIEPAKPTASPSPSSPPERPQWDARAAAQAELLRRRQAERVDYRPPAPSPSSVATEEPAAEKTAVYEPSQLTARISPSMMLDLDAMGFYAEARLHAVMRAIDTPGRGVLQLEALRARLCDPKSPEYLYGWRRLRKVLANGAGVFWTRRNWGEKGDHIHVKGRGRILAHFGLRVSGHEVVIPLGQLLGNWTKGRGPEAASKAAVYAAALAERTNPMSRKARENAYGLSRWRQWRYENRRQVRRKTALVIGGAYSDQLLAHIRREQPGAFAFVDWRGKLGPAGGQYIAYAGGVLTEAPKDAGEIVETARNRRRLNAQATKHSNDTQGVSLRSNGAGDTCGRIPKVWFSAESRGKAEAAASKENGRRDALPVYAPIRGVSGGRRAVLYDDLAEARASRARAAMREAAELARGRGAGPSMFTAWGATV